MGVVSLGAEVSGWKRWFALAGLSLLAIAVVVFAAPNQLVQQVGLAISDPTGEGRWPIAKDTLGLIAAYPLVGSGLGTYSPTLLRYQTAQFHVAWMFAHNDYLQLLSELDMLGSLIPSV